MSARLLHQDKHFHFYHRRYQRGHGGRRVNRVLEARQAVPIVGFLGMAEGESHWISGLRMDENLVILIMTCKLGVMYSILTLLAQLVETWYRNQTLLY
jgi:hypothetical protein